MSDSALQRFLAANRRLSSALERRLPQTSPNIHSVYAQTVAAYMNGSPGQLVADVGGGRSCEFAALRDRDSNTKIVAVDIADEELRNNTDVDETRVADITIGLPFADGEVDLIASRGQSSSTCGASRHSWPTRGLC